MYYKNVQKMPKYKTTLTQNGEHVIMVNVWLLQK